MPLSFGQSFGHGFASGFERSNKLADLMLLKIKTDMATKASALQDVKDLEDEAAKAGVEVDKVEYASLETPADKRRYLIDKFSEIGEMKRKKLETETTKLEKEAEKFGEEIETSRRLRGATHPELGEEETSFNYKPMSGPINTKISGTPSNELEGYLRPDKRTTKSELGTLTEKYIPSKEQARLEAEIKGQEGAVVQESKKGAELKRLVTTGLARAKTMSDRWIKMVAFNKKNFGWKPGPASAIPTMVVGKLQQNPFYESFKGMGPEYGAGVARTAMPGIRAFRSIKFFQIGAPNEWSTVESGINNSAATMRMQMATYIGQNKYSDPDVVSEFGSFDDDPSGWTDRVNTKLEAWENQFKTSIYRDLMKAEPSLVPDEWKASLESEMAPERQAIEEKYGLQPLKGAI